ncbi:flagellar hook-associated protein FlgK [Lichenibacterium minor]|uniref:Flagellar hook-associated protein 1 n=1 Tax=Lichenibacterium minor TaxID=2316528 RepID=A0A4Q2U2E1_9HYPH|nr:flagellar hook-associated protein FlgK [Lichenibacterium minor]RYC30492.1 flagellar hook-associated protein FlgK [Lichenibacterium minor]
MGLTTTLNIAQQALTTNAALSTIVSRNIAGVNDTNYATRTGRVETTQDGGVRIAAVTSATDDALFANLLSAKSGAASSSALSSGLSQLEQTLGLSTTTSTDGTSTDTSPATLIGALTDAVGQYAASPSDVSLGTAAVTAARALATNLNTAAATVQSVREGADKGITSAVATVNSLLGQFATANAAVVNANIAGTDGTDAVDSRNAILQSLSTQLGITTADAANGGLALYTDGGATLFQGTARTVAFTPTAAFASGTVGGAVTVDGVAVTGAGATMASKAGTIAGLAQLRDTVAVDYGDQLDQIAQGLVTSFSESDQTGGTSPTIAGLFTDGGSAAIPTSATGLAASLTVSAAVDPSRGGSITKLRDGGINAGTSTAYTANTTGAASYAAHLVALTTALDTTRSFDSTSGGASSGTLAAYAASSVSWLESSRQSATTDSTNKAAVVTQTTTSLSSATGVNLDDQLSKMLDLEHSYQASAELITTVKSMLDALLAAVN